jgi:hypothetical protein
VVGGLFAIEHKKFNEKLEEHLDDTNFILQGENDIDLKFLEDLPSC